MGGCRPAAALVCWWWFACWVLLLPVSLFFASCFVSWRWFVYWGVIFCLVWGPPQECPATEGQSGQWQHVCIVKPCAPTTDPPAPMAPWPCTCSCREEVGRLQEYIQGTF